MLDAGNRVPGTDGDRGVNRREGRTCYCSETPPSLRVGAWRIGMSHVPTNVCPLRKVPSYLQVLRRYQIVNQHIRIADSPLRDSFEILHLYPSKSG